MDRLLDVLTIEICRIVLSLENYASGKGMVNSGNSEHEIERDYGPSNTSDGVGHCENESASPENNFNTPHRVKDMINIKSWVQSHSCIEDLVLNVAIWIIRCIGQRKESFRWVCKVLLHIIRVVALCCDGV
jgi:hypothetical protein